MPNLDFEIANALYIHIPFCSSKCPYCDFYSTEYTKKRVDQYWAALFVELAEFSQRIENNFLQTIYLGGGTPSLVDSDLIRALIKEIKLKFKVSPAAEITMEVNPASINEEKIISLKRAGINRLSIGIQSFNDYYLSVLARESRAEHNKKILNLVNKYFNNYSTDLIFALPGQKTKEFAADLKEILNFKPPHISLYNLELHQSTDFYKKYQRGEIKLPSEETDAEMYQLALEKLKANNYFHYEISNFSQKGFRAKHNYIYWLYQPYLALGPGAAGFNGQLRYQNKRNLIDYLRYYNPDFLSFEKMQNKLSTSKKININNFINNKEEIKIREFNFLTKKEMMAEYSFLALRTAAGLFFHKFYQIFKSKFKEIYKNEIIYLKENNLIKEGKQRIYLTERGKEVANEVFLEFLLD